jgi:hypothetical protein
VLFTFPSRYWFTIGRTLVFSLGRWSSRIPTGFLVSRGTWETDRRASHAFTYGTVTLCGRAFQIVRLACWFVTLRPRRDGITPIPATPGMQRSRAVTHARFRLFPVRSPLLGESRLLSVPGGTEMVHFPPFASHPLLNSGVDDQGCPWPGFPIRRPSGQSLLAAHRGLSQLTASFIALVRLGIHRMPLVA